MLALFKHGKSELILVLSVVAILLLLFTPIPATFLDLLLLTNFSLALVILLLTFYTDKPLSFSTFPSLILIATLFRLGLNVSSTRLILNDADAGQVISAVGAHVVGGNYVIGLVVFLILIVVQYVVVTNGAQRVAEVAARFTLDSMPGKQMSIDADLNMGLIDEQEAKDRRLAIEKEANFYGAMDGSTKFVKGDAIAGIIIILINIVGGLSIGVAQHGMAWGEALHTFTLLTVGDGIVTQIPSLVVATATGIIITRAASDSQLGQELSRQITSQPKVLIIIAATLLLLTTMPGLPLIPLLTLAAIFAGTAYFAHQASQGPTDSQPTQTELGADTPPEQELYQLTRTELLELRVSREVAHFLDADGKTLTDRLQTFRKTFAQEFGIVLPQEVRFTDPNLAENEYLLAVQGATVARGEVASKHHLAIDPTGKKELLPGQQTKEPTYGLPAIWIEQQHVELARQGGYTVVDPETTMLTHLTETLKRFAPELLTRSETEKLLNQQAQTHPGLLDELVPSVMTYSEIQKVLQQLLQERVSVRNLVLIMEELVDAAKATKEINKLCERVRLKLKNQLSQSLADKSGVLNILTLSPRLEQRLLAGVSDTNDTLAIPADVTEQLLKGLSTQVEAMLSKRLKPILLCTPMLRRALFLFCERALPQLSVLSMNEIPTTIHVKAFAMVTEEKADLAAA